MNFFNSIFADDDPDPPKTPNPNPESPPSPSSSSNPTQAHQPESPNNDGSEQVWSFGGLIKTLQVKSDWIDTYKRDLQEFGSGLKKETQVFREVASKSLDLGAAKAQVSLESVGQAIDTIGSIISHGKDSLLSLDNDFSDNININNNNSSNNNLQSSERKYSRFDAQLSAIQRDVSTFVDDPDDVDEYKNWKSGFNLEEKSEEIEGLLRENGSIDGIYKRVVPETVDHDEFWCRYYYRVHRFKQAENVRAKLVKRAISTEDDEELSWDVDDEDGEEEGDVKRVDEGSVSKSGNAAQEEDNEKGEEEGGLSSVSTDGRVETKDKVEGEEKSDVIEAASKELSANKEMQSEGTSEVDNDEESKKSEEKVASEGKKEPSESGKESDISVVSTQPSHEDDDMGWDEIEDVGSGDENKVATRSGSPNREELRKRLSAADEDEDLSWDIEDDD